MDPKDDKKKKRTRSVSPKKTSVASTPSLHTKSPSVMDTPPHSTPGGNTSLNPPTTVSSNPFIAGKSAYPLKDIVVNCDFSQGIIKARCTGMELKEKTGKNSGKPFWVAEVLLTDTVTRMLSLVYYTSESIPVLPSNGDLVAVTGVKAVVAIYDARLYGPVQFVATPGMKMTIIKVEPTDPRLPAHWSPVSIKVPQNPIMSLDEFMQDLC